MHAHTHIYTHVHSPANTHFNWVLSHMRQSAFHSFVSQTGLQRLHRRNERAFVEQGSTGKVRGAGNEGEKACLLDEKEKRDDVLMRRRDTGIRGQRRKLCICLYGNTYHMCMLYHT